MKRFSTHIIEKLKSSVLYSYAPRWVVYIIDLCFTVLAASFALILLYEFKFVPYPLKSLVWVFFFIVVTRAISFLIGNTYHGVVRHTGTEDAMRIFYTLTVGEVFLLLVNAGINAIYPKLFIPIPILLIEYMLLMFLMVISRFVFKAIFAHGANINKQRVVIYGSDEHALSVKYVMEGADDVAYRVVAFVDDESRATGKVIEGVRIVSEDELDDLLVKHKIDRFVLAKSGLSAKKKRQIVDICLRYNVNVMEVPDFDSWIKGSFNVKRIKKVKIEDLLGRGEIQIDETALRGKLKDKTILVTGAAGSIGSEIVRQLLQFNPVKIILFDQAETPLYDLELEMKQIGQFDKCNIEIGDVRDIDRIDELFSHYKPDIVYHAAAYKHVPMMENHPVEGIKTNVFGTKNVADCAVRYNAETFVMVSTDKAVNPTNVMGASKRIAEIYTQSLNSVVKTKFITTRFGNVLGSNGSVIHRFKKQIEEGGPVTVTHPDITRYFMTIPEACQLVLQAGMLGQGGEIFVFDMGESVKIIDLAKKMIKLSGLQLNIDIQIEFTGLRPGEKLFEEVLNEKETTLPTINQKIKIAQVRRYNYEEVVSSISELSRSVDSCKDFEVVEIMKQMVPEYKSQNSKFEKIDIKLTNGGATHEIIAHEIEAICHS